MKEVRAELISALTIEKRRGGNVLTKQDRKKEKFSTGEMLDRLGINDTAVNQRGYVVGYDEKGNLLCWDSGKEKPETKEDNDFLLYYPWVKKDEWEIRPHFYNFEEALHALTHENKTIIYYHSKEMQYAFTIGGYDHFMQLAKDGISLSEIAKGKWIIVK